MEDKYFSDFSIDINNILRFCVVDYIKKIHKIGEKDEQFEHNFGIY